MNETREATWKERATWGECPICGAQPGQFCDPHAGFLPCGYDPPKDGAHLGRIQNAPLRVRLVATL